MPLTPEQRDLVAGELKRFATDLNLSEDQNRSYTAFCQKPPRNCRNTGNRTPVSQRRI